MSDPFERLSNPMKWILVIPTAILALALSYLILTYTCIIKKANNLDITDLKTGTVEVSLNNIQNKLVGFQSYLNTAINNTTSRTNSLSDKVALAKSRPEKFFQKPQSPEKDHAMAITGMTQAVTDMKNQIDQMKEQQQNLRTALDDLNQIKMALRQKR